MLEGTPKKYGTDSDLFKDQVDWISYDQLTHFKSVQWQKGDSVVAKLQMNV